LQNTFGLVNSDRSLRAFLFAAIGIGIALRFVNLGGQSLWVDEMLTLNNAYVGEELQATHIFGNFQGPVVSLLMHFWAKLSWNEYILRIPFAVAGGLTVIVMYIMARYFAGPSYAEHTTLFAALSPIMIWYSQEIRGYAFALLFTALITYFLMRWLDRRESKSLIWYGVFAFAGLLSNLSVAFVMAAHFLFLLLVPGRRRMLGKWMVAVLVVLLLFSPWVRHIAVRANPERVVGGDTGEPLPGGARFSAMALPYSLFTYSVGYSLGPSVRDLQIRSSEALRENLHWIILAGLVFAVPTLTGLRRLARENQELLVLLLLSIGIPLLAVSVLAIRNVKVFTPRYALVAFPAYALIVGLGLTEIAKTKMKLFILVFAGLLGISIFNYFMLPAYAKDDARETASAVMRNFGEGDAVVAVFTSEPLRHYLRDFTEVRGFEAHHLGAEAAKMSRCREIAADSERVWLSLCREWIVDPEGSIQGWFDRHMVVVRSFEFPGMRLYLYEKGKI
jgi:mannosyltransferase